MPGMRFVALVLAGLGVAACSSDSAPREVGGTAVGAVFGGLLGNRVGAALDEEDRRRAFAAQLQALETRPSGAPVAWRSPDSGHYGNVVPGPVFDMNGAPCREYTHTIYIDGRPQSQRGTACRTPDGAWIVVPGPS